MIISFTVVAVAAGDDQQRNVELPAPEGREAAKRGKGVGHGNQVSRERCCAIRRDQRRHGTLRERGGDEVVTVEALAFQRDEEIARFERAAVGDDAPERDVVADQLSIHGSRGGFGIHHAALHADNAAADSTASEKGIRTPWDSW